MKMFSSKKKADKEREREREREREKEKKLEQDRDREAKQREQMQLKERLETGMQERQEKQERLERQERELLELHLELNKLRADMAERDQREQRLEMELRILQARPEFPPAQIYDLTIDVAKLLMERQETVSVAETAAGGLISAYLASTPGASSFYKGGLILYTLESCVAFAGWTQGHLASYQGPSKEVVVGLASSVRVRLGSTYCVCERGSAGPSGGSTLNTYPGFVALAIASERGVHTREISTGLGADRTGNMMMFAIEALGLLKEAILSQS